MSPGTVDQITKLYGPEKAAAIRELLAVVAEKGVNSPEAVAAMAKLLSENKGDLLKHLIPFSGAASDMACAMRGRDASGRELSPGERVWSLLKGLAQGALDAHTFGLGSGAALTTVGRTARAAQLLDSAESFARWGPALAQLMKNPNDPKAIAAFVDSLSEKTVVERATGGAKQVVTSAIDAQRPSKPSGLVDDAAEQPAGTSPH